MSTAYQEPSSYHSDAIAGVAAAFLAIATVFTTLRFFVRGFMIRALGWDDWLILLALGHFICQAAFLLHLTWMEKHKNLETFNPLSNALEVSRCLAALQNMLTFNQYVILEFAFYLMTTAFLKLSLAVFFLRILLEKWQRRVIIISTAIFSVYTFAFFFVAVFQCGNPAMYLLHKVQGTCVPWRVLAPLNYIHGVMNALTDWVFVSLPILVVRKANMRGRDKASVMLVLTLGVLGSVASVVRLFYIKDLHAGDSSATSFFSNASTIAIASIVEPGMGIMAACLATLRPLFKSFLDHTRTHGSSRTPKDKISSTEKGISSRGPSLPPQSPHRSEFAAYGFVSEGKSRAKSEPQVELSEMPSGKTSMAGSDESARPMQRHESQSELLAELEMAKQAYSARIWSPSGETRVQPNLLLPDI